MGLFDPPPQPPAEEPDPIRALAAQNAARETSRPRRRRGRWVLPFLAAAILTGLVLAGAYYWLEELTPR